MPAARIGVLLLATALLFAGCDFIFHNPPPEEPDGEAALELVAEGLTSPVTLAEPPDETGRLFIVDQTGLIRIVMPDGTLREEPFLDLRDRIVPLNAGYDERGLLGLAFHPDYANSGRFFVYYSAPLQSGAPAGWNNTSHISEFEVSADDPNKADPTSEKILLKVDEPQLNHAGGTVAFGPEGYLYISLGDGGGADDKDLGHVEDWYATNAGGNGQDVEANLLGNILRIDVDGGDPYGIPSDNPFAGKDGRDEIYAYGFRNPYRFSFDQGGAHDLLVGDAGQELWEEVSVVTKGGNYGWNVKEGTHCFDAEHPDSSLEECPQEDPEGDPLIDPVIEFANAKQPGGLGFVVVGGYVYRGEALPQIDGRYLFGAWSTTNEAPKGRILIATPEMQGLWDFEGLALASSPDGTIDHYLLGFGQDAAGEVYVLTTNNAGPEGTTGKVFRLAPPQD